MSQGRRRCTGEAPGVDGKQEMAPRPAPHTPSCLRPTSGAFGMIFKQLWSCIDIHSTVVGLCSILPAGPGCVWWDGCSGTCATCVGREAQLWAWLFWGVVGVFSPLPALLLLLGGYRLREEMTNASTGAGDDWMTAGTWFHDSSRSDQGIWGSRRMVLLWAHLCLTSCVVPGIRNAMGSDSGGSLAGPAAHSRLGWEWGQWEQAAKPHRVLGMSSSTLYWPLWPCVTGQQEQLTATEETSGIVLIRPRILSVYLFAGREVQKY